MDISWAFKLLAIGAGIYTVGYLMERKAQRELGQTSLKGQRWFTVENTQNALDNWQIADIMAYAQDRGLTFHEALQAHCDRWNGDLLCGALT